MAKKMPILLLGLIAFSLMIASFLPLAVKQALYTLSLELKAGILLVLPLLIFALLYNTTSKLAQSASSLILLIFAAVILSNFTATFLAQFIGYKLSLLNIHVTTPNPENALNPLWVSHWPKLMSNDKALILGVILGLLSRFMPSSKRQSISDFFDACTKHLLKGLTLVVPFFVIGFVVKLAHEQVIQTMWQDYALIFSVIFCSQIAYLFALYAGVQSGNVKKALFMFKNMLPAALTGFSTMSSAAAMPLTILGAQKNATNKPLARSIIPASVNIHLIGDCIAIPILAFALLYQFGLPAPTMSQYLIFTGYFVIAKFSVAAIPGGGILVMLPILEQRLGLHGEMLSLITALYILFDPIITGVNILGNGALAKIIDKSSLLLLKNDKLSPSLKEQIS